MKNDSLFVPICEIAHFPFCESYIYCLARPIHHNLNYIHNDSLCCVLIKHIKLMGIIKEI